MNIPIIRSFPCLQGGLVTKFGQDKVSNSSNNERKDVVAPAGGQWWTLAADCGSWCSSDSLAYQMMKHWLMFLCVCVYKVCLSVKIIDYPRLLFTDDIFPSWQK